MTRLMLSLMLLAASAMPLLAQVYKHVDEDGKVTYSDQPLHEGDEPVELKSISVIPGRKQPPAMAQPPEQAPEPPAVKFRLDWLRPEPDQVFWNIGGQLTVELELEPGLPAGHRVEIWLDGRYVTDWAGGPVQLDEVWRGEHRLEARLLDVQGRQLTRTSVTFYVQQKSLLIDTPAGTGG